MSMSERIRSNYEVHGALFTLQWAKRNGINFDTVHFALLGKYRGQRKGASK